MKLYYFPGACSMAVDIALREAGVNFELEKVDLMSPERKTESGKNYLDINPKGYVPALELDNGEVLTEAAVALQYIADQNPGSGLAPQAGSMERYRLMEMLHFLSTELHKQFGGLFNPQATEQQRQEALENIGKRMSFINERLGDGFLMGDQFTVADCYFGTILGWCQHLQVDLSPWPNIGAYAGRVMQRPAVQETLKAEGLA